MSNQEQAVYISYAWGKENDEREKIVNQLDQSLQRRGLTITRDKRDLGYRESIRKFMERIGEGNCVIVVISDKYLRSKNCMYELVEIAENKQFADRIFPIILEDANIYNWRGRVDYIDYWEKEKAELTERIRSLKDLSNLRKLTEELDDCDRFRDEIDKLTGHLSDMNCLTPEILKEADFNQLYEALMQRMQAAGTPTSSTPVVEPDFSTKPRKERKTMDPNTLATAATTLLAPYISKVGEKAMEKIGEHLPEKVGKLWNAIAKRFEGKPVAADAANGFVNNAESTDYQEDFARQLRKVFQEDGEFATLLTDLLEEARSEAGISNVGDGVVATNGSVGNVFKTNGSISGSTITISSTVQSKDSQSRSPK